MSPTTKPTPATTPEWPPAGWLKKKDAATKLGLSVERVAGLVREQTVKSRKARDPELNQVVTLIDAADVERILAERANPEQAVKFVADKPDKPERATTRPAEGIANALIERLLNPPPPAPAPRPWLTISEAVEFSGLTKKWLEDYATTSIVDGAISRVNQEPKPVPVRDMGKGARGGRYRFLRADLERG